MEEKQRDWLLEDRCAGCDETILDAPLEMVAGKYCNPDCFYRHQQEQIDDLASLATS